MEQRQPTLLSFRDFARELTATSNMDLDLSQCYGCARCSAVCRVALFYSSREPITPRSLLYRSILGEPEELLEAEFIWLCSGCGRCEESCPQGVRISEIVRALRRLALKQGHANPLAARVYERICMHCGACVNACPNQAISLVQGGPRGLVSRIDLAECRGCGSCSSVCSNGAVQQSVVTDADILDLFAKGRS